MICWSLLLKVVKTIKTRNHCFCRVPYTSDRGPQAPCARVSNRDQTENILASFILNWHYKFKASFWKIPVPSTWVWDPGDNKTRKKLLKSGKFFPKMHKKHYNGFSQDTKPSLTVRNVDVPRKTSTRLHHAKFFCKLKVQTISWFIYFTLTYTFCQVSVQQRPRSSLGYIFLILDF